MVESLREKNPLQAEVREDGAAEGHAKRLDRYSTAKRRQSQLVDYIVKQNEGLAKPLYQKELAALVDCGSFLLFRYYLAPQIYKMVGGCTCKKHLLCALCAIRRAARSIAIAQQKLDHMLQSGDYDAFFVTLTVKNGDDLQERFEHLVLSYQKLLHARRNALNKKRSTSNTCYRIIEGAFAAYEVTYNDKDQTFHPHIHSMVLVHRGSLSTEPVLIKKKVAQVPVDFWRLLSDEWKEITGDSFIVDVRKADSSEDMIQALVECFKYSLKMQKMDPGIQLACYDVLKGRRLHSAFGCLYGIKFENETNDELLPEDLEYIDLLYRYSESFGYQLFSNEKLPDGFVRQVQTGCTLK